MMLATVPTQKLNPQQQIIGDAPQQLLIGGVSIQFREGSVVIKNEGDQPVNVAESRQTGGDD